jgi:hypothetical protein
MTSEGEEDERLARKNLEAVRGRTRICFRWTPFPPGRVRLAARISPRKYAARVST